MSLSEPQLNELLGLAKQAALAAGEIIAAHQGEFIQTQIKDGGTSLASKIVTDIDLKAEKEILTILRPSLINYDLGLLTEETTDDQSRFHKEYFWCIDPLDGTLPFTQNEEGYATSIALVSREGKSVLGVVYDPRNKNLYWAIKGAGAYKNGELFTAINADKELTVDNGPGGAVMQAITTIENAPAVFYKKPKAAEGGGCLWDYAATSIIHTEAGGLNSDYSFKPLNLNASDSVYMNHVGISFSTGLSIEELKNLLQ